MSKVSVIDFYSDRCSPCKNLAKDLDSIAESVPIEVQKVNIEENFELVEKYCVMSVPTLVVIKDGEAVDIYTGYKGKDHLTEFLIKYATG